MAQGTLARAALQLVEYSKPHRVVEPMIACGTNESPHVVSYLVNGRSAEVASATHLGSSRSDTVEFLEEMAKPQSTAER